jgi:CRISPR/Cas system type I-B associated protein Csh2 (Cas7 group RAMP superfamily)
MTLSNSDIERIAQLIFEKLLNNQSKLNQEEPKEIYQVYDDLGNVSTVEEEIFLNYELERLDDLELKYVENEEFEKANIIKNKINKIKLKI